MNKENLLEYLRGCLGEDRIELAKMHQLYADERKQNCPENNTFYDDMYDTCEEWCDENDLPEGYWLAWGECEDLLWEL